VLDQAAFYATPSPTTDLSSHEDLVRRFPGTPHVAADWARNVILHVMDTRRLGLDPDRDQLSTVNVRSAGRILDVVRRLNPAPLERTRPPEARVIGDCHHLAVVVCALLRHAGVAARIRYGFVPYIKRGRYEDHCICEVFLGGRWRRFDPGQGLDIGDELISTFVTAGDAWAGYRAGRLDVALFGSEDPFVGEDWRGLWYVRDNVVRDFAALCKVELSPCDFWGLMVVPDAERPDSVIDELARLTETEDAVADRLARFCDDALVHPGPRVSMFDAVTAEMTTVELPNDWWQVRQADLAHR
jgi:transglutaminase superfamily protein